MGVWRLKQDSTNNDVPMPASSYFSVARLRALVRLANALGHNAPVVRSAINLLHCDPSFLEDPRLHRWLADSSAMTTTTTPTTIRVHNITILRLRKMSFLMPSLPFRANYTSSPVTELTAAGVRV
jgi:hypothetical protein